MVSLVAATQHWSARRGPCAEDKHVSLQHELPCSAGPPKAIAIAKQQSIFPGHKHQRASSCSSFSSMMFDLELEEETLSDQSSSAAVLPSRFQSLLQHIPPAQLTLWHSALEARDAAVAVCKVADSRSPSCSGSECSFDGFETAYHEINGSPEGAGDSHSNGSVGVSRYAGGTLDLDIHSFAQRLADQGFFVWLRSSKPGKGSVAPGSVSHTYVVCSLPVASVAGFHEELCIVDPLFKQQFMVAGASQEYLNLLSLLPDVFVGNASQLKEMVTLLCQEMERSFDSKGLPCPPWRSANAMLSRWLVTAAHDEKVEPRHPMFFGRRASARSQL